MAIHHVEPGEIARLSPLGEELPKTRTYALVKTDRFEAVRLVVQARASIPAHAVDGPITIHCLEGKFTLTRENSQIVMQAGDWVHLRPGETHSLDGLEDSSALLTIMFP